MDRSKWQDVSQRLGLRLRDLRNGRQLTQESVAELSDLHRVYYGRLERGEENPTLEVLVRLSLALETPLSSLFKNSHELGRTS